MTKSVGVHVAKTHLSELLDEVVAGGDVVITRWGQPVARLISVGSASPRSFGLDRGRLRVPEDFDAALPDLVAEFES